MVTDEIQAQFDSAVDRLPTWFAKLESCRPILVKDRMSLPNVPAVYAMYEAGVPIYVGRSGKKHGLKKRINNHTQSNHNQASFVYKLTRDELRLQTEYKKGSGGTRSERMQDPWFLGEFEKRRTRLLAMEIRFVEIHDDIDQYLFELYASMLYKLDLSGFSTH